MTKLKIVMSEKEYFMLFFYIFIGIVLVGFVFVTFCLLRMASMEERRMEREQKRDLLN